MPHQAALHVVAWYRQRFGERWRELIAPSARNRGKLAPWSVWYSESRGGWCARVWEFGAPVEVTGRRKAGHAASPFDAADACRLGRGRLLVFADRPAAERAVRRWIYTRWGVLAPVVVYRARAKAAA